MDLKEVCLELVRRRRPDKSDGTCQASELSKLRSGGVLIRMSRERSGSKANEKGCDADQKISMLHPDACIENTLYAPDRNLNRGLIERLAGCDWIRNGEHCVITGATGSGKTWLASALMNAAIRAGFRAKYYRVNDLLLEYAESASNTSCERVRRNN